jgi:hypothetical protein
MEVSSRQEAEEKNEWWQPIGPKDFKVAAVCGLTAWPVYTALLWFARQNDKCYPGIETIANLLGVPYGTVKRNIAVLVSKGVVERKCRRGTATVYRLLIRSAPLPVSPDVSLPVSPDVSLPVSPDVSGGKSTYGPRVSPHMGLKEKQLIETRKDTPSAPFKTATQPKRFTPPSVEEVAVYCRQRNNTIDPEEFVDFYEAKGWMIGKSKMISWQASVRTWEKKCKENGRQENQPFSSADATAAVVGRTAIRKLYPQYPPGSPNEWMNNAPRDEYGNPMRCADELKGTLR